MTHAERDKETSIFIRGTNEHLTTLEDQLKEEEFSFNAHHRTYSSQDTIELDPVRNRLYRWCHGISPEVIDLNANLPSHRKCFMKEVRKAFNGEQ